MSKASSLILGGLEGTILSNDEKGFIKHHAPSGVTLFSRNIRDAKSLEPLELIQELQKLRGDGPPFFVAVDQEGGRVARFKHPALNPGAAYFWGKGLEGEKCSLEIEKRAYELGAQLLKMGLNINFAPIVDVSFSEADFDRCYIGDRAFASDPESVTVKASAYLKGANHSGLLSCLKHFPGLGRIKTDTHLESARYSVSEERLWKENLLPFRKLHSFCPMIMVGHAIYPEIDSREASRSTFFLTDLLRHKIGFQGLIVSDDLNMHAVSHSEVSWEEFLIETVLAGCDFLLICEGLERWKMACDILDLETKKSPFFRKRVDESFQRIQALRQRLSLC